MPTDSDDWETAWDSGETEAQLAKEVPDAVLQREKNKKVWDAANKTHMPVIVSTPSTSSSSGSIAATQTSYRPELKILKRPSTPSDIVPLTPGEREKGMSAVERERKYQEARERIMGSQTKSTEEGRKIWEEKDGFVRDKGVVRAPRGAAEGRGFGSGRGRG